MVHQSPRSSGEYEALMREWGAHFTCIAPDTPGFGQSDALSKTDPDINDYADAIAEFIRALGLNEVPAYGFHSGGIILVTALQRHPGLFSAVASGAYAVWTAEESAIFDESYLPPFLPTAYGEHLTWLWNRILEQSWFFPWFDVRGETRLSVAHDNPALVHPIIIDMLDAGDNYRAVLRAPRDIPPPETQTCPVLISTHDADPLQAHFERIGVMPANWQLEKTRTARDHQDLSLAFLQDYAVAGPASYAEDKDRGFIAVKTERFDGLIHWCGKPGAKTLRLHSPGSAAELVDTADALTIDLPGHGLSDGWDGDAPTDWADWQSVIANAAMQLGTNNIEYASLSPGDADRLFPDLTPDRFGSYLTTAWSIIRAEALFAPWYEAKTAYTIDFDQSDLDPTYLAKKHRALIRAIAAKAYHQAYSNEGA
jgi:haloalkane dehalogenase